MLWGTDRTRPALVLVVAKDKTKGTICFDDVEQLNETWLETHFGMIVGRKFTG